MMSAEAYSLLCEDAKDITDQVMKSSEIKFVTDQFSDSKNREKEYEITLKSLLPFAKPFLAIVIHHPDFHGGTYRRIPVSLVEPCRIYAEGHDMKRRMKYQIMLNNIISKMKTKSGRSHNLTLEHLQISKWVILPPDPEMKSLQQILCDGKFKRDPVGLIHLSSDEEFYTCLGTEYMGTGDALFSF
jgi:hypothetical protein